MDKNKIIAAGAKTVSEVSSSDVWNALANNKTVTHGLAGGGLGMVANAGYNYTADDRGGYLGSAMAGAGAAIAGSVAWRSGGKKLAHTASDKVKQSVATEGGTEDFSIRMHKDQHLTTNKAGDFDIEGHKRFVDGLEKQLGAMDPGAAKYSETLKQHQDAQKGLDHMQSVVDNRLSSTPQGVQKLKNRYGSELETLRKSQDYKDVKFHDSANSWRKTLREDLDGKRDDLHMARSAHNLFKKGGGDLNSAEGQELVKNLSDTKQAFNSAGQALSRFKSRNEQRFNNVSSRLEELNPNNIRTKESILSNRVASADNLLNKFKTDEKTVLRSVNDSINMSI